MSSKFEDVSPSSDKSALLKITSQGADGPRPIDLWTCWVHYKLTKTTATGDKVKDSTRMVREKLPKGRKIPCVLFDNVYSDYTFGNVQNDSAEPKQFVVGEGGVPECVDFVVRRLGAKGTAILKLAPGCLPEGRPAGEVTLEVELVTYEEPSRGPEEGGDRSIAAECALAEDFLRRAEEACGQLEGMNGINAVNEALLETLNGGETRHKGMVSGQAADIGRNAVRAARRFRRAGKWLEGGQAEDGGRLEVRVLVGLAKAVLLQQRRFAGGPGGESSVKSLMALQARSLALRACQLDSQDPDAQATAGSAQAELGELAKAREYISAALLLDPHHRTAKSELARISLKEKEGALLASEKEFSESKDKLDAGFKRGDAAQVKSMVKQIISLIDEGKVSWEACVKSKLGKTTDDIIKKHPNAELGKAATEMRCTLDKFWGRKCRQLI